MTDKTPKHDDGSSANLGGTILKPDDGSSLLLGATPTRSDDGSTLHLGAAPTPDDGSALLLSGQSPPGHAWGSESPTCDGIQCSLDGYVAGELGELERVGVDHHLAQCQACRVATDEYFEVVRLAAALPPLEPSPEVANRLRAFIGRTLRPLTD